MPVATCAAQHCGFALRSRNQCESLRRGCEQMGTPPLDHKTPTSAPRCASSPRPFRQFAPIARSIGTANLPRRRTVLLCSVPLFDKGHLPSWVYQLFCSFFAGSAARRCPNTSVSSKGRLQARASPKGGRSASGRLPGKGPPPCRSCRNVGGHDSAVAHGGNEGVIRVPRRYPPAPGEPKRHRTAAPNRAARFELWTNLCPLRNRRSSAGQALLPGCSWHCLFLSARARRRWSGAELESKGDDDAWRRCGERIEFATSPHKPCGEFCRTCGKVGFSPERECVCVVRRLAHHPPAASPFLSCCVPCHPQS